MAYNNGDMAWNRNSSDTGWNIYQYDGTSWILKGEIKNGENGVDGAAGADGKSVTRIEQSVLTSTPTFTDYQLRFFVGDDTTPIASPTYRVNNGTNGTNGTDGKNGNDGNSTYLTTHILVPTINQSTVIAPTDVVISTDRVVQTYDTIISINQETMGVIGFVKGIVKEEISVTTMGSIKGPKGDEGTRGPQGPAGATGATGAAGKDGSIIYFDVPISG